MKCNTSSIINASVRVLLQTNLGGRGLISKSGRGVSIMLFVIITIMGLAYHILRHWNQFFLPKNLRILIQCINTNFVIWTKYACCKFSNNFSKVHCTHFLPHYYFMAQETLSQQNYTGLWTAPGCLLSKWSVSYRCLILCFQSMLSLPIIIDPLIIYLLSTALYFEVLETLIRKYKVCFK